MKAEFLHQYYQTHGVPLRARAFAYIDVLNGLGSYAPRLYNFMLTNTLLAGLAKRVLGVAPQRSLPTIHRQSLRQWYQRHYQSPAKSKQRVLLFCDEFTNRNDTEIGIKGIKLLRALGYDVQLVEHPESGRAAISKGLLTRAQRLANENVKVFKDIVSEEVPLLGIEPSAILSFRDEYPRLVEPALVPAAKKLAQNALLIDEFLAREIRADHLTAAAFTDAPQQLHLHGHCHQKSLGELEDTVWLLSLPENYHVSVIPSGCCGMAGSFGYEAEHFEVSQQVGELVLFPAVRKAAKEALIVAPGTSCRHQISDATERRALHPVEVLWAALR